MVCGLMLRNFFSPFSITYVAYAFLGFSCFLFCSYVLFFHLKHNFGTLWFFNGLSCYQTPQLYIH